MESNTTHAVKKFRRTKYIINPKFQYFMLAFSVLQSCITVGIFYALNVHFFNRFKILGLEAHIPQNHIYFQFLNEQQDYYGKAVLVVFFLISIVLIASVTLLSHRIAGPLYRLTKHMQETSSYNDLKDVHFRKNDFFPEIANNFNQMLYRIKKPETKKQDHVA